MRYQEYEPPVELSSWVKLFWVFESRSHAPAPETLVADGCPELIIHFRSPFAEFGNGKSSIVQPNAIACGQLTRPLTLRSSQDAGMLGIRFQPDGMAAFHSESMQSLTDLRLPAESLFPNIDQLVQDVVEASTDVQRIKACCRFLQRSVRVDLASSSVRRAVAQIIRTRGCISVESLATLMGRSRRSVEMAFQKEVGTSPKMYCRITRFRNILDAVTQKDPSANWVNIALETGFFDQSHLIRDFRQITGDSPTVYLAEQSAFAQAVN